MSFDGFICPICRKELLERESSLVCKNGHSFDLAKEGYCYLLPVQSKKTKAPGDNKEMIDSRARFLSKGYYDAFAFSLAKQCEEIAKNKNAKINILDMGCGEGYYSQIIADYLSNNGIEYSLLAIDISKFAVKRGAKRKIKNASFAVASCFDCPVKDGWADIIINVFAPFAQNEINRILKKDGRLIYAVPGARHLFGMKSVLYDKPYENEVKELSYDGFRNEKTVEVSSSISVPKDDIASLFCMTPYFWKTPKDGEERLSKLSSLETEIHFRFINLTKI